MITSGWKVATIASAASLSDEVDLGMAYEWALIIAPDLTTDTVAAVQIAKGSGGTFVDLYDMQYATPGDVDIPKQKASIIRIGGAQYLKIDVATNQGAERLFDILAF